MRLDPRVSIARRGKAAGREGMGFRLFGIAEILGKVDNAGGIRFMESYAPVVLVRRHVSCARIGY